MTTTDYDVMRKIMLEADVLVGHNIIRFDIPVIERILDIKIPKETILVDTLALSWYLQPKRNRHNLDSYGDDFDIEKPKIDDWENLSIEEYKHRCEEDVRINTHLWNAQYSKLIRIYESEEEIWKFVKYLAFKMHCAQLQEKSGWKLDTEFTERSLTDLKKLREQKFQQLLEVMPRIPVIVKKSRPKVLNKKDGSLSKHGEGWYALLETRNLPPDTLEVDVVTGYEEPNPGSVPQVKDWLFSLGWKPITFKTNKKKKEVPQISLKEGKGLCPSVIKLFEAHPYLEALDGFTTLAHRISILEGFLETLDKNGFVQATVQGLTNTLRFQHAKPCVNLPRSNRPFAEAVRGSLIAPEGFELCGADMASLEDRLKQHFIYPLDPEYVESMNQKDFDPHLTLALMAGMMTEEEVAEYKSGNTRLKPTRDIAKNGNYACQYGAYPPRLAITCDISLEKAKELFEGYWKLNWSIKAVAESQKVKEVDGEKWLFNPVSKFWYSLRKDNDRFSTLIQGTASYVFDLWVSLVLMKRQQLTAQFHDEIILCVKTESRDSITEYLENTINRTNEILKLNRRLDIGIQYGDRYSEIH